MNSTLFNHLSSVTAIGITCVALSATPTIAATFNPAPLFEQATRYSTVIPRSDGGSDVTQIYYPVLPGSATASEKLPIALLFQGALVDQSDYETFASTVARYGFAVVVPNHFRTLPGPTGPVPGLFPEQQQVNDVLSFMTTQNSTASSPLAGQLDISNLVLLGHSFGGAVGLASLQNECVPNLCTGTYQKPAALKGGAFYGTSFFDPRFGGTVPPINNQGGAIALIAGSVDGVAKLADVEATYAQIQTPPKALVTVLGANHYSITNQDNPIREPNRPTLEQAIANETIARWSALFLRSTILDDPGAFDYVFNSGDQLDHNVITSVAVPEPSSALGLLLVAPALLLKRKYRQTSRPFKH